MKRTTFLASTMFVVLAVAIAFTVFDAGNADAAKPNDHFPPGQLPTPYQVDTIPYGDYTIIMEYYYYNECYREGYCTYKCQDGYTGILYNCYHEYVTRTVYDIENVPIIRQQWPADYYGDYCECVKGVPHIDPGVDP